MNSSIHIFSAAAYSEADFAANWLQSAPEGDGPLSITEARLTLLWQDILGQESIDVSSNFFDLGGDSWDAVRIISALQEMGFSITLDDLADNLTIASLAAAVERAALDNPAGASIEFSPDALVQPLRTQGDDPPLFLIHPLLGLTFPYARLAHQLGPQQPVYTVRAAGLATDESTEDSIPRLASRYIRAIREVRPQGPYRLAGWSFGGWVAHEMARQLSESDDQVDALVLIDTPYRSHSEGTWRKFWRGAAFAGLLAREIWPFWRVYREMVTAARTAAAAAGAPPGYFWQQPLIRNTWRVYLAAVRALQSYAPKPFAGRTLLVRAENQYFHQGADLSWGKLAGQSLDVIPVPGNHLTLLSEPGVQRLAAQLQIGLNGYQATAVSLET
jgi:thioesterase domain-containing protein/acyl carrier protein